MFHFVLHICIFNMITQTLTASSKSALARSETSFSSKCIPFSTMQARITSRRSGWSMRPSSEKYWKHILNINKLTSGGKTEMITYIHTYTIYIFLCLSCEWVSVSGSFQSLQSHIQGLKDLSRVKGIEQWKHPSLRFRAYKLLVSIKITLGH